MAGEALGRSRVLLADDHPAAAQLWRQVIEPEFEVVAIVDGGNALVDACARLEPDVIVSDIAMPDLSGIVAAEIILRRNPAARIVFVTVHADRALLGKSLAIGAFGYVLKVRVGEDLLPAVRAALRGDRLVSPFPPWETTARQA